MDEEIVGVLNSGSKKKQKRGRKSQNTRHLKYVDNDPMAIKFSSPCDHHSKRYKCNTLSIDDVIQCRQILYSKVGKTMQDIFLTRFISAVPTNPSNNGGITKKRHFNMTFYLQKNNKKMITVCKAYFLKALGITERRVATVSKSIIQGTIPKENRGGDRKSEKSLDKKAKVKEFISSLPAKESHYNRKKSKRIYLSYELNIRALCNIYNHSTDPSMRVNETMFRRIFENEFNIGFRSPASDVCSTCVFLNNKLKIQTDHTEKQETKTEIRVHKARANAFYSLTKDRPASTINLCFDLQQVQPLPKTPIQECYYLRQIGLYVFCIVDMDAKTPHFYIWTENQASKGSVEIGSALISHLCSFDFTGVSSLRLFADGCGGQNKNSHVIHSLMFWLWNNAPSTMQDITITYPVRGHSFLPADRVFGRVEKELRKKPFITNKEIYYDIYQKHGVVHVLGTDWKLYDVKKLTDSYTFLTGIRDLKRIMIKKRAIEQSFNQRRTNRKKAPKIVINRIYRFVPLGIHSSKYYKSDLEKEPIQVLLKPNKVHHTSLTEIPPEKELKGPKKADVIKILRKQFGESWNLIPELSWYKEILLNNEDNTGRPIVNDDLENSVNDDECDCEELDIESFI